MTKQPIRSSNDDQLPYTTEHLGELDLNVYDGRESNLFSYRFNFITVCCLNIDDWNLHRNSIHHITKFHR